MTLALVAPLVISPIAAEADAQSSSMPSSIGNLSGSSSMSGSSDLSSTAAIGGNPGSVALFGARNGVPRKAGDAMVMFVKTPSGQREFLVRLPRDYSSKKTYPVVINFGGKGHNIRAENNIFNNMTKRPRAGVIEVLPQGKGGTWEGAPYSVARKGEDVTFVKNMLARLNRTYKIDNNRIYANGFSNGGGFAANLACRMPETFAAVVSVSGAYYDNGKTDCAKATTNFFDAHGTLDPVIHYDGGEAHGQRYISAWDRTKQEAKRNGCKAKPVAKNVALGQTRYTYTGCKKDVVHLKVEGGGHVLPVDGTVWSWMLSKRKGSTA